jgi:hypothetical protein
MVSLQSSMYPRMALVSDVSMQMICSAWTR